MNPSSLVKCSAGPAPLVGAPTAKLLESRRVYDRPYIGRPIMILSLGTPICAQYLPAKSSKQMS